MVVKKVVACCILVGVAQIFLAFFLMFRGLESMGVPFLAGGFACIGYGVGIAVGHSYGR